MEATALAPEREKEVVEEVEEEGDAYGVYSKRGKKRGRLEDRYSAACGLHGDFDQVNLIFSFFPLERQKRNRRCGSFLRQ